MTRYFNNPHGRNPQYHILHKVQKPNKYKQRIAQCWHPKMQKIQRIFRLHAAQHGDLGLLAMIESLQPSNTFLLTPHGAAKASSDGMSNDSPPTTGGSEAWEECCLGSVGEGTVPKERYASVNSNTKEHGRMKLETMQKTCVCIKVSAEIPRFPTDLSTSSLVFS